MSRDALRELDRRCVQQYAIPSIVLMENASIGLARGVLGVIDERRLGGALILCGPGNNGGDGLGAARHLHNAGVPVRVALSAPPRPGSDAAVNHEIARRMGLAITALPDEPAPALDALARELSPPLIVDALLGTGLDREVGGVIRACIEWINASGRPVVSADLPSGMGADSGRVMGACVSAGLTCTFAARKRGFAAPGAPGLLGRVEVCPSGAPRELLDRLCD